MQASPGVFYDQTALNAYQIWTLSVDFRTGRCWRPSISKALRVHVNIFSDLAESELARWRGRKDEDTLIDWQVVSSESGKPKSPNPQGWGGVGCFVRSKN